MDQQTLRMETALQREYENEDWSTTFRAGPDSVGILAECIVITSRPKVSGIELKDCGLEYATLSANVIHCADLGAKTFITTGRNMKLLAQLTNELSQPNGVVRCPFHFCCCQLIDTWCPGQIETMLKFCEPGQSSQYIGQKRRQEQDVKIEVEKNKVAKELKEDQTRKEEAKINETKQLMQTTREKKEKYETKGFATSAVVTPGLDFVVGGAAAYIHYRALKAELLSMEEAEERRNHEIRELEASKATLEQTLAQLSAESESIDEVAQIVAMSFKKVTELQQLVRNFMSFLLEINTIISYTAKRSQFVYEAVREKEDLIDPLIKRVSLFQSIVHDYGLH
ncbi:hypothetical protein BDV11DRAFT_207544 [Aspergillus similis]